MIAKKKADKFIKSAVVVFVIIILWYVISKLGIFSAYIFPSPLKVWKTFVIMLKSGELITNLGSSIVRVIIGFFISFLLALLFGILASMFPRANPYYRHILEFLRHIPPMSLIPLLILWMGIGEAPKIVIIVLTAFFPIFINTESGIMNCDKKLLEVGTMLDMPEEEIFFKIRIPAAVPDILVGMQIGLGYSWRAIVGAEMIAAASGLGYMILDAQTMSRTDKALVGIILIGLFGLVTDKLFTLAVHSVNRRMGREVKANG